MVSLSSIATDQETLNPGFFLLYAYFLDRFFLDREKVIFLTFTGLVKWPGERKTQGRYYSGGVSGTSLPDRPNPGGGASGGSSRPAIGRSGLPAARRPSSLVNAGINTKKRPCFYLK